MYTSYFNSDNIIGVSPSVPTELLTLIIILSLTGHWTNYKVIYYFGELPEILLIGTLILICYGANQLVLSESL